MADPSGALIEAIVVDLKAAEIADGRVYDTPPPKPVFPYVSIGPHDSVGDDNSCWDASEVNVQIDVWSRAVGFPEASAIASQIRDRLTNRKHLLLGFTVSSATFVIARLFRDPDGLTSHAALTFRYVINHDVIHSLP